MEETQRKQSYVTIPLISYTQNTITSSNKLEKELEIVRRDGVAFDNCEYDPNIWSVGAPIYNSVGSVIAGIAIVAPSTRINDEKVGDLITLTKNDVLEISREMGYTETAEKLSVARSQVMKRESREMRAKTKG